MPDASIRLVIFDVDGTLAKAYSLHLLAHVADFFKLVFQDGCSEQPHIALATNQGGVGMRFWMETAHFGAPKKYPTEQEIEDRLHKLVALLTGKPQESQALPVYVSYRYQDRHGKWSPLPPEKEQDPHWAQDWRKPGPGMLRQAIQDAQVSPVQAMYVGDSPEDQAAARAAGCHFAWASDFFARDWSQCSALADLPLNE